MDNQELLQRVEQIEIIDGVPMAVVSVSSLTADEFAELIMHEVHRLQEQRQRANGLHSDA